MKKEDLKAVITFITVAAVICGCFAYIIPQCKSVRDVFELLLNWFCVGIIIDCIKTFLVIIKTGLQQIIDDIKKNGDTEDNDVY